MTLEKDECVPERLRLIELYFYYKYLDFNVTILAEIPHKMLKESSKVEG